MITIKLNLIGFIIEKLGRLDEAIYFMILLNPKFDDAYYKKVIIT